jgi:hypothetical protein
MSCAVWQLCLIGIYAALLSALPSAFGSILNADYGARFI